MLGREQRRKLRAGRDGKWQLRYISSQLFRNKVEIGAVFSPIVTVFIRNTKHLWDHQGTVCSSEN